MSRIYIGFRSRGAASTYLAHATPKLERGPNPMAIEYRKLTPNHKGIKAQPLLSLARAANGLHALSAYRLAKSEAQYSPRKPSRFVEVANTSSILPARCSPNTKQPTHGPGPLLSGLGQALFLAIEHCAAPFLASSAVLASAAFLASSASSAFFASAAILASAFFVSSAFLAS